MISLAETFDMDLIKLIVSDSYIWDRLSDGVEIEDYQPTCSGVEQWLLVLNEDEIIGVIAVDCMTTCTLAAHPYLYKKHRRHTRKMIKTFFDWFLESIPDTYIKLVGETPNCFQGSINSCLKMGFKVEGVNRQSFRYNGKIYDQTYIGITREEMKHVAA